MTRVVESVAAEYSEVLIWQKVITKELSGARRYQQFSKSLGKPAPVPSIVIDGELVFETTPGTTELKACLDRHIKRRSKSATQ